MGTHINMCLGATICAGIEGFLLDLEALDVRKVARHVHIDEGARKQDQKTAILHTQLDLAPCIRRHDRRLSNELKNLLYSIN